MIFFLSLRESHLAKKTVACQQGALLKGKALSCLACLYETSRLLETKPRPRKVCPYEFVERDSFLLAGRYVVALSSVFHSI